MKSNTFKLTAVALAALVAALPLTASAEDTSGPASPSSSYAQEIDQTGPNTPKGSDFVTEDEYVGEAHGTHGYTRLGTFDDVEVTEPSISEGGGWK